MPADEESGAEDASGDPLPGGLRRASDIHLEGRRRDPLIRRAILSLIALFTLAALLGAFGQRPATRTAAGASEGAPGNAGPTLTLKAPDRLRGGVIFAARIEVEAGAEQIEALRLELADGWLDRMTNNTIRPEPLGQEGTHGALQLSYGRLAPGRTLTVWSHWQVNPTSVGTDDGDVSLYDGERLLARINRTFTIFP